MDVQTKVKWKTVKMPGNTKMRSLCKGIEVLDSYTLISGDKRKFDIDEEPTTDNKKLKNVLDENEKKDENENSAKPGRYVLANINHNNEGEEGKEADTDELTKERKGSKKKNKNEKFRKGESETKIENGIKVDSEKQEESGETEQCADKSEGDNKKEIGKKKRKRKPKEKKAAINFDVLNEFLKNKEISSNVDTKTEVSKDEQQTENVQDNNTTKEVKNKNKTKKDKNKNKTKEVDDENKTDEDQNEIKTLNVEEENEADKVNEEKMKNKDLDMSEWKKLNVCDEIIEALRVKGFSEPTEIQKLALPSALGGVKDIVGAAETGSGKTLVFAIPMIQGILKIRKRKLLGEESDEETDEETEQMDYENDQESDQEDDDENENESDRDNDKTDDEVDDPTETTEEQRRKYKEKKHKKKIAKKNNAQKDLPVEGPTSSKYFLDMHGKPMPLPDDMGLSDTEDDGGQEYIRKNNAGQDVHYNSKLRGLIMTPTRELAVQIKNHIQDILKMTNITVAVIFGGMSHEKQLRLLKRRPDIVVGTPGRIWELYNDGVPHLQNLQSIKYFAIDETDRMGEKGHYADLEHILEVLKTSKNRIQKFVLSATLSLVHKRPFYKGKETKQLTARQKLKQLMEFSGIGSKFKIVDITLGAKTAENLHESVIFCNLDEKDLYLYYFVKSYKGRTIAFCNSIEAVKRMASVFRLLEVKTYPLHAKMEQRARLKNLDNFVSGENCLLIATDVAARGLDIPNIDHVIHYQVPRTTESYIHRSGRTARAHNTGISILLLDPAERKYYMRIRDTLKRTANLPLFPVDDFLFKNLSDRVNCAHRLDKLMHRRTKLKKEKDWFTDFARKAELVVTDSESEDDIDTWEREDEKTAEEKIVEDTKAELQYLLDKTIYNRVTSKYPGQRGAIQMMPTKKKALAAHSAAVYEKTAIEALNSDLAFNNKAVKECSAQQKKLQVLKKEQMKKMREKMKKKRNKNFNKNN